MCNESYKGTGKKEFKPVIINNDNKGVIINGEEGIYSRGNEKNIEGKNIKENWNDREGIRSTKKSFRVNNKDIITYGTKPSISKEITYDLVKNENYNKEKCVKIFKIC